MIFHNCKDASFETVNLVTTKLSVKFTNIENKPCFQKCVLKVQPENGLSVLVIMANFSNHPVYI